MTILSTKLLQLETSRLLKVVRLYSLFVYYLSIKLILNLNFILRSVINVKEKEKNQTIWKYVTIFIYHISDHKFENQIFWVSHRSWLQACPKTGVLIILLEYLLLILLGLLSNNTENRSKGVCQKTNRQVLNLLFWDLII